jgi:YegS/Rv2252/BmrU family lipid kinase
VSIAADPSSPLQSAGRRVLLVLNPGASRASDPAPQIRAWFAERARLRMIDAKAEGAALDIEHLGRDADLIVIGGGDGTISKALPSLLKLKKPFAVLPLGTANDFARTLGLPSDPLQAAGIALRGRLHAIDVGLVNGKPYLNVASVGVAAKVAEAQSAETKKRWRMLAYALALLKAWRGTRPVHADIVIDGKPEWSGRVYQVGVGNGRFHGGGLRVAPDAAIDDGRLDIYLVQPGRFLELLRSLLHLKFNLARPKVLTRTTGKHVSVRTRRPHPVDADGELLTETPAEFAVLPCALQVIVPREPSPQP